MYAQETILFTWNEKVRTIFFWKIPGTNDSYRQEKHFKIFRYNNNL